MKIKKTNKVYTEISLPELKQQLNMDSNYSSEDTYLTSLIEAATDYCESLGGFDIVTTDNELTVRDFNSNSLTIYEENLSSISSIELDGVEITEYELIEFYTKFKIEFDVTLSGDLVVSFKTGGSAKAKHTQAVLIKASDFYDAERQSYTSLNHNANIIKYLLL